MEGGYAHRGHKSVRQRAVKRRHHVRLVRRLLLILSFSATDDGAAIAVEEEEDDEIVTLLKLQLREEHKLLQEGQLAPNGGRSGSTGG